MKPVRIVGAFIALAVLAGSVVLTLARVLDSGGRVWVLAASFVPWAVVGYLVAWSCSCLLVWRQPSGRLRRVLDGAGQRCLIGIGLHVWSVGPGVRR